MFGLSKKERKIRDSLEFLTEGYTSVRDYGDRTERVQVGNYLNLGVDIRFHSEQIDAAFNRIAAREEQVTALAVLSALVDKTEPAWDAIETIAKHCGTTHGQAYDLLKGLFEKAGPAPPRGGARVDAKE